MRQINSGTIILAVQKPALYDEIDELATWGWVAPVWASVSENREQPPLFLPHYRKFSISRFNHHTELLHIFLQSAREDVSEWTDDFPLKELSRRLSGLEDSLSYGDGCSNLGLYRVVETTVNEYLTDRDNEAKLDPSVLINLADACFDVMTELEGVSAQIITSVS